MFDDERLDWPEGTLTYQAALLHLAWLRFLVAWRLCFRHWGWTR